MKEVEKHAAFTKQQVSPKSNLSFQSVDEFRATGDISEFCESQKRHYRLIRKIESTFGAVIFAMFGFSIVILTANAYFR